MSKEEFAIIIPVPETFLVYCPHCGLLRNHSLVTIPWTTNDILTNDGFVCERCGEEVAVQFSITEELE